MAESDRTKEIPPHGLDTAYGRLYRPLADGWQVAVLVAAFAMGPVLGWAVGLVPGDLSEAARTGVQAPFVLIFFFGYATWIARLNAIAFDGIGRALLKTLFVLIVKRRKPSSMEDVLPSHETLLRMAVRAQQAGASFGPVSWPIGLLAGGCAMLFDSAMSATARFVLVAASSIAWGHALGRLGRRGFLPFMEEG